MTHELTLQIDRDGLFAELDQLATFSDAPAPAVTRVLWSATDRQGRAYVAELCRAAGLDLREDAVGNLFARWNGSEADLPAVASGSHVDAIPNAGRYDGTVGVLGVIEAIRALKRVGFQPRRSIELVLFNAEEPTRFGIGCLGSRVMAGTLDAEQLVKLRDKDGNMFEDLRAAAGFGGRDIDGARLEAGHYAAFVELHIEQGPLLEAAGLPIGVVQSIAAPSSMRLHLKGEGGHAGAVLMPIRHDALLAAAEVALAVERAALATGSPDSVATTGVLRIEPGAINSIPRTALLEIDIRDVSLGHRDQALAQLNADIAAICERRGVQWQRVTINADPPATCDPALVTTVEDVCRDLEIPHQVMISRAYHDTLFMARICPVTMIFIPCRGGVSHRPDEYAAPDDIARGVEVLAHTFTRLAAV